MGAAVGSRLGDGSGKMAATAIGAAVGMMLGANIGKTLDEPARMTAAQTTTRALNNARTGDSITWNAPNSGGSGGPVSGIVTITKQGTHTDGRTCREYVQTVEIGGQKEKARGVACRHPYGEWVPQGP